MIEEREKGTVKWFNDNKGYGFIQCDAGKYVFIHCKQVEGEDLRSLGEGQVVSFQVTQGPKGFQAEKIRFAG